MYETIEDAALSSFSAVNPGFLYESNIVCAKDGYGRVIKNDRGEKVICLKESLNFENLMFHETQPPQQYRDVSSFI